MYPAVAPTAAQRTATQALLAGDRMVAPDGLVSLTLICGCATAGLHPHCWVSPHHDPVHHLPGELFDWPSSPLWAAQHTPLDTAGARGATQAPASDSLRRATASGGRAGGGRMQPSSPARPRGGQAGLGGHSLPPAQVPRGPGGVGLYPAVAPTAAQRTATQACASLCVALTSTCRSWGSHRPSRRINQSQPQHSIASRHPSFVGETSKGEPLTEPLSGASPVSVSCHTVQDRPVTPKEDLGNLSPGMSQHWVRLPAWGCSTPHHKPAARGGFWCTFLGAPPYY